MSLSALMSALDAFELPPCESAVALTTTLDGRDAGDACEQECESDV
jgi:hypothetical protein